MINVISQSQDKCKNCIKCLKACPVDAISIVKQKVQIDESKCIHCDVCIKVCPSRILKVESVHMSETLKNHEYNVVLIPTSILSDLKSFDEFHKMTQAILKLGFDEVIQYSDVEGFLYKKAIEESAQKDGIFLTSFCPTINALIAKNYPTLFENILPYNYPVEVAAKKARERLKDKDVGIYSLCECVGKMTLAKEPFKNENSYIDYAMSISHVFPKINRLKSEEKHVLEMNKYGVKSNVEDLYGNRSLSVIRVEGLNQAKSLLELLEFDQINHVDLIAIYACYQGCIGGYYLWSNPFEGCYNIESMLDECVGEIAQLKEDDYLLEPSFEVDGRQSIEERLAWFEKVNKILETLPQYDCGACGYANCRALAQGIVEGQSKEEACRVKEQ